MILTRPNKTKIRILQGEVDEKNNCMVGDYIVPIIFVRLLEQKEKSVYS